jgi:hypothetical protein
MQGAPEADTGSVHERTLRMADEEQRRRWGFINGLAYARPLFTTLASKEKLKLVG